MSKKLSRSYGTIPASILKLLRMSGPSRVQLYNVDPPSTQIVIDIQGAPDVLRMQWIINGNRVWETDFYAVGSDI